MTATAKVDKKWSDKKKMDGEDSLRTLDCLRGRLLAERQASRMAKEEAELMGNKLIELENKLREETKLRQKADKKLKFLMKKFESLKISPTLLEGLEQSSSSETGGFSCSSSTCTSGSKDPEESASIQNHSVLPIEKSSSTQDTLDSNSNSNLKDSPFNNKSNCHSIPSCQDSKADSQSCSNSEAPMVEMERNGRRQSDDEESDVDKSLALVPVSLAEPTITKSSELNIVDKSINEVLDALRHAREKIQSSMELRRNMIRVGPT